MPEVIPEVDLPSAGGGSASGTTGRQIPEYSGRKAEITRLIIIKYIVLFN
jgi:hypothetical protein